MVRRRTARRAPRMAKLNPRQKTQVKRLIGNQTEDKIIDTAFSVSSVTTAGSVGIITLPAIGTGVNQRVGEEITIKKLQYNVSWEVADVTNLVRLIIFRWGDNNAISTPVEADVLVPSAGVLSFWNDTNTQSGRVKILFDKTLSLSLNGNAGNFRKGSVYGTKLGKKKLVFNTSGITATDAIYILVLSDSGVNPSPAFEANMRLHYTDA